MMSDDMKQQKGKEWIQRIYTDNDAWWHETATTKKGGKSKGFRQLDNLSSKKTLKMTFDEKGYLGVEG